MARRSVSILFVCTGNICRSPTAEAVMRVLAEKAGRDVRCESAGTGSWHEGERPDPRAVSAAQRRGYDMTGMIARAVMDADFTAYDHLIALDHSHKRWLLSARDYRRLPERARISLLMDWSVGQAGRDVPDPYYGGSAEFERALDLIEKGCQGLISRL
ncbi:low molecular weight phosphotyrosine protein phosphatase [Alkalicaulis satelles]|uniref:protein-tyrosine-phosphatase n=1 Tax=Alkalicaulis satelles TaxID=2609175 RepID=A0A5M6ZN22_9PROT|nr:low molecular weight protein-tyrosine-phosphatase [Alkalicaulis satelles]KAA5803691.1 low molecular weight phosphotyrosine protein phosphatase [Alkalicaulis satelles]